MNFKKVIKNKIDFIGLWTLYHKQKWLANKEDILLDLYSNCETKSHRELIRKLLFDFKYISDSELNSYLDSIAEYIVKSSAFTEATTQVSSITFDDRADSSQKILDYIKMTLFTKGWSNLTTVNRYGRIKKNYDSGYIQIILVDEFIGSGQTISGRIKQLQNDIKEKFELKLCFIAGMDYAIKELEKQGYEVFCPLRLTKAISERFSGLDLINAIKDMEKIETSLSTIVNQYKLSDYSFGYNKAEATYSLEGCRGNTPNSVFPIFWWPRNSNDKPRATLLTRFEKNLK